MKENNPFIYLKCLVIFLIIALTTTIFSSNTSAQSLYEKIDVFNTLIFVNADGTIDVTETIYYDFGPNQKHGIYREIPYQKTNVDGEKFNMIIDVLNVTDTRKNPYQFTTSNSNGRVNIKIGDPDKYVTGEQLYQIKYKVSGALTYFTDHDELYWNATGDEWSISITHASVKIFLPQDIQNNVTIDCYTGVRGSSASNCISVKEKPNMFLIETKKPLNPYEGLTFAVGFPKGYVAVLEPQKDYFDKIAIFALILAAIAWFIWSFIYPIKIFLNWYKDYKNSKKAKITSAWFSPPKEAPDKPYPPAITALLVNKKFDNSLLTSSIIHLAQRGFFKIVQEGKKDFNFVYMNTFQNNNELYDYEFTLLKALFNNAIVGETVSIKSLKNNKNYLKNISDFNKKLSNAMVSKGLLSENIEKINKKYSFIGGISLYFLSFLTSIVAFIFGRKSAKRTDFGIEKLSEAISLKNFLTSQDEQLDFQAKNQMFFEKLLPYATSFGVEDIWVKRFADLEFRNPDWYEGDYFNALTFSSFSSSFSSGIQSASMSATRSSRGFSSGGGGGGSSGGGGGGGGGGSW